MEKHKIWYMCKYTPLELFAGFSCERQRLESVMDSFENADAAAHPNLCGYGKALLEACTQPGVDEVVLVNCCDVARRVYDVLKEQGGKKFLYLLDLPHHRGRAEKWLFESHLRRLVAAYEEYSGLHFDAEKAWEAGAASCAGQEAGADGNPYISLQGAHGGPGFGLRLIRLYVDGSIFNDFKYRIQFQAGSGTPHVKDFYIEWAKYTEFSVKFGQFKRAFTFENPMNPWDVGVGDFSFLVQKFAGMGDRLGEANMGGRDLGLQVQGDLIPIGSDNHNLLHYQLGVYNGQGINLADADTKKDLIGTLQFQPIKGLKLGVFGWKGNWINGAGTSLKRERVSAGLSYDVNNWTLRGEYATAVGEEKKQSGAADAFYITAGVPVRDWLKFYVKWDEFRSMANSETSHDMYSAVANFRLHKNLNFQLEYRFHHDNLLEKPEYNELWFQAYIRF